VLSSSQALGQSLARLTYGDAASCGNGTVEFGEQCDDGNDIDTDACRSDCTDATCRDGVVWEGVEECDDGNADPYDLCDNECRQPVCGDGIVAGNEQCDDGNAVPDDGCTACTYDPVPCGAGGITARVTLSVPGGQPLGGGTMDVQYPVEVSLPGSGRTPELRTRVRNVSGAQGLLSAQSDDDTDQNGVDDTLRIAFASTSEWPVGPFAEIDFDCAQGTDVVAPSIGCRLVEASDPFQNGICGDNGVGGVAACDEQGSPAAVICAVTDLIPLP
jgi:cysteine-rich repeat protein